METTYVSINRLINKENIIYTYNEILFSLKKEGNSAIYDNMGETGSYYYLVK